MKTKSIVTITFALLFSMIINAQNNVLQGNWQASNGTIMSFSGTNVNVGGDTYTFAIQGTYLSMYNQQGDVLTYTYQVEGNQLYLYLEGSGTYILTKVGNNSATTSTQQGNSRQFYGNWQASNGTIMSFNQTNVNVGGEVYTYQVSGNSLTMYNGLGDSLVYTYQLNGNQLTLNLPNSGTFYLTKVNGNANSYSSQGNTYNGNRQVGGAGAERLYGSLCNYSSSGYSGSSSYSTTRRITFDGRGHYQYGSQSSYSGNGDGYSGGNGGNGGTYKVVGNEGVIMTEQDGTVYRVAIHYITNSGEITELKYDGAVYGKTLCD